MPLLPWKTTSKTGLTDIAVQLDSRFLSWIGPVMEELKTGRPDDPVWVFTYGDLLPISEEAAKLEGPEITDFLRHSGASADKAGQGTRLPRAVDMRKKYRHQPLRGQDSRNTVLTYFLKSQIFSVIQS